MDNYLKEHKHKEGSFILGKVGDEWQMVKEGEFFSACPFDGESGNLTAINNNDRIENYKMLKKKVVAIIRSEVHNSIRSVNKLAGKAGYDDFEINYDEIIEMLKLKSYELFED